MGRRTRRPTTIAMMEHREVFTPPELPSVEPSVTKHQSCLARTANNLAVFKGFLIEFSTNAKMPPLGIGRISSIPVAFQCIQLHVTKTSFFKPHPQSLLPRRSSANSKNVSVIRLVGQTHIMRSAYNMRRANDTGIDCKSNSSPRVRVQHNACPCKVPMDGGEFGPPANIHFPHMRATKIPNFASRDGP